MITSAHLTYVGHATVLIEMDGLRLLTDPLLRDRAGPLRRRQPPVNTAWHRDVDAVLISHLHWDHFDVPSLRRLNRDTHLIVPRGAANFLKRLGFDRVEEMHAESDIRLGPLSVKATGAHHSGFRPPFGPRTACLGYVVNGSRSVYFAGDTDLFPEMTAMCCDLDAALLPVWGWGPMLGAGHLDPQRAAQALTLLRPRVAVPIHWGTLCPLGMGWARPRFLTHPPRAFAHHAARLAPEVEVRIAAPGQPVRLAH